MTEEATVPPEIEVRAKEMGWIPKEQFKGDEGKWIDAATFVERGETLLPIVRADKRKLEGRVASLENELAQAAEALRASQESIQALKEVNDQIAKDRAKSRKAEIAAEIKEAREADDVEKEQELLEELGEITVKLKEKPQERQPVQRQNGNGNGAPDPDTKAWMEENTWFGQDEIRTDLAIAVGQRLRRDPATRNLKGRAFLDKLGEELEARYPSGGSRSAGDRVEGGGRGSASFSSGGKSYSDLPPEAKAACESQGKRLIGTGKAFKDQAAWRDYYVKKYFE